MMLAIFVKSSVILLAGLGATTTMRRTSAALRHAVWISTLIALLLMPIAGALLPSLEVRVPSIWAQTPAPPAVVISPANAATAPLPSAVANVSMRPMPMVASGRTVPWLALIWLAGITILVCRLAGGYRQRSRLSRAAAPAADGRIADAVRDVCATLRIRRSVTVMIAPFETMPATWGIMHPSLLLPPSVAHWADARLRLVLLHELAHVARLDAVTHGIAQFTAIVMWWQPLTWVAVKGAQLERERACDDTVLRFGVAPSYYAHELLDIAGALSASMNGQLALAIARESGLKRRLGAILDVRSRHTTSSRMTAAIAAVVLLATLPIATAKLTALSYADIDHATPPSAMMQVQTAAPNGSNTRTGAPSTAAAGATSESTDTIAALRSLGYIGGTAASPSHRSLVNETAFNGTWIPLEPEKLAALFDTGLALVGGSFAITVSNETVTLAQDLPANRARAFSEIMGWNPATTVYAVNPAPALLQPGSQAKASAQVSNAQLTLTLWRAGGTLRDTFELDGDTLTLSLPKGPRTVFHRARLAELSPQSPTPKPFGEGALRSGNGVSTPVRLREVRPVYTEAAKRAGLQGKVELEAVVGADGTVTDVRVTKSLDRVFGLDANAKTAALDTPFLPCRLGDQAVPCIVVFELFYKLDAPDPVAPVFFFQPQKTPVPFTQQAAPQRPAIATAPPASTLPTARAQSGVAAGTINECTLRVIAGNTAIDPRFAKPVVIPPDPMMIAAAKCTPPPQR